MLFVGCVSCEISIVWILDVGLHVLIQDRCFGYAQGVMGGLLTVPAFLERFPQVDIIGNDSFHNAWVTGKRTLMQARIGIVCW